jgi:hypothetical protein
MTGRLVVPTLAGAPPQNQSLGGFRVASCESRAKAEWQFTTADARIKLKRLYPAL